MFTGLVETTGRIVEARRGDKSVRLGIAVDTADFDAEIGASVAVSGACLTVERQSGNTLYFTAVHETLARTTLRDAAPGTVVNLERSLQVGGRLDGHFVQGHVDGAGRLSEQKRVGDSTVWTIVMPRELMPFMAEKGSVTIDGISLTVSARMVDSVQVSLIPHTVAHTTMATKRAGETVNVECDVLARYLRELMRAENNTESSEGNESLYARMMRDGF